MRLACLFFYHPGLLLCPPFRGKNNSINYRATNGDSLRNQAGREFSNSVLSEVECPSDISISVVFQPGIAILITEFYLIFSLFRVVFFDEWNILSCPVEEDNPNIFWKDEKPTNNQRNQANGERKKSEIYPCLDFDC